MWMTLPKPIKTVLSLAVSSFCPISRSSLSLQWGMVMVVPMAPQEIEQPTTTTKTAANENSARFRAFGDSIFHV
jgi:hypothetical protein